jgi:ATP-dependent Clp protease ATP-binding subunit ClpA
MFERFTDRARRVVVLAQEEARMLNHDYIGTEHILLGLLRENEGVAARVLTGLGLSLRDLRKRVRDIIGEGSKVPTGHVAFTPRSKMVLELALREAVQLGQNYIGTEHILLGLIREKEGVAAQVFQQMGLDLARARAEVIRVLGMIHPGAVREAPPEAASVEVAGLSHRAEPEGVEIHLTIQDGLWLLRVWREEGTRGDVHGHALARIEQDDTVGDPPVAIPGIHAAADRVVPKPDRSEPPV